MAQDSINHISKNKNKSLEAVKEREEEQLAHFPFCKERLSSSLCRYVLASPRVAFLLQRAAGAHTGGR